MNNTQSVDPLPPAEITEEEKQPDRERSGFLDSFFKGLRNGKNGKNGREDLREVLEEYIIDQSEEGETGSSIAGHEKILISNVLSLRDLTVSNVMIPRADITAIDIQTNSEDLFALLGEQQYTRIPVYRETMDDIVGTVHIKDIVAQFSKNRDIVLKDLVRKVPIVSPSMPVLDLLLEMQETKKHMALVIDEFGGIDGLITIGDVIEAIVGKISDEHDNDDEPALVQNKDKSITADARVNLNHFEEKFGVIAGDNIDREEIDTLGGLIFMIAGRVPARGEVIKHESGIIFEVLEADLRRVHSLRIKNLSSIS